MHLICVEVASQLQLPPHIAVEWALHVRPPELPARFLLGHHHGFHELNAPANVLAPALCWCKLRFIFGICFPDSIGGRSISVVGVNSDRVAKGFGDVEGRDIVR